MSRYQTTMSTLRALLARARAPIEGHHGAIDVGDVVPVSSRVPSHQAVNSASRHTRPLAQQPSGPPPDGSLENPAMLGRIRRTVVRWRGRQAGRVHR